MKKLICLFLFVFLVVQTSDDTSCGEKEYINAKTQECESCDDSCKQCNGPRPEDCIHCHLGFKACKKDGDFCQRNDTDCSSSMAWFSNIVAALKFTWQQMLILLSVFLICCVFVVIGVVSCCYCIVKGCKKRHRSDKKENGATERLTVVSELYWDNGKVLISSGAFSKVYKCPYKDENGDVHLVAVKEAREGYKKAAQEREIMLSMKEHRHIIKLITTKMDDDTLLVMPLRMCDLANFLKDTSGITMRHKIKYCQQIADAMSFLMPQKILHCDLKASNILVVNENLVEISDFGKSQKMDCKKCTIGTITHTAMELLDHRGANCEATDVWSFGVTIWEIFNQTRQSPYANVLSEVNEVTLLKYLKATNRLKTTSWPSDLRKIESLMLQCWTGNPENRLTFDSLHNSFSTQLQVPLTLP